MAPKRSLLADLAGKRSELGRLRARDALLAKVVVDIHRHAMGSERVRVPLRRLEPTHPLDRPEALADLERRVATLAAHRERLAGRSLSKEELLDLMPSVSGLKAVDLGGERLLLFEGNGRLEALRRVFGADGALEVEVYRVDEPEKILRRLRRFWRHGGRPGARERVEPRPRCDRFERGGPRV